MIKWKFRKSIPIHLSMHSVMLDILKLSDWVDLCPMNASIWICRNLDTSQENIIKEFLYQLETGERNRYDLF